MLAKVIKRSDVSITNRLVIPSLNDSPAPVEGVSDLVIPSLASYEEFAGFRRDLLGDRTDEAIHAARDEAARIVAQAEERAAQIENAAAHNAELAVSASEQSHLDSKVEDLRAELTSSVEKLGSVTEKVRSGIENDVVELALQIAKKIVAREVTIDRDVALTLVKVSLEKLHNRCNAKVHLHPDDLAYVKANMQRLDYRGSDELVEDRSISLGGCLVQTDTGDIDARIESQFDEIAHGLLN